MQMIAQLGNVMLSDRIEGKWIDVFCETFARCGVKPGDSAAILSETQSRALNVHLAELALLRLGSSSTARSRA
jgi:2,5-dihydroxypyridine 5,6-dioxygenase